MAICPKCQTELAPDSAGGLCPACLLAQGAVATAPEMNSAFSAPTIETPPPRQDAGIPPDLLAAAFPQLDQFEFLGRGGMGVVYKARQKHLDRFVALKILSPQIIHSAAFTERFGREARALARLNHPNIVAIHDFGQVVLSAAAGSQVVFYLIMEYVDGSSLRSMVRGLNPAQALAIVPQVCEALQFAHDAGVVHRDIKPENILIDRKGRVKIADFGLAKLGQQARSAADYTLTSPDVVMGTPHYMAPEQMERPAQVDHRADIYSLGVVFYEMLTGELPLGRFQPPSSKVHVDVRLDEVVLKSLEKEPDRRYQHASEVRTSVQSLCSEIAECRVPQAQGTAPISGHGTTDAPEPRIAWVAVAGLCCGLIGMFCLATGIVGLANLNSAGRERGFHMGPNWAIEEATAGLVLWLACSAVMMLLGGTAVRRIRRRPDRLYGLRLAILDLLFTPLLILDALVVVLPLVFVRVTPAPTSGQPPRDAAPGPLLVVVVCVMIVVDVLVYWLVWRRLRVPAIGPATGSRSARAESSKTVAPFIAAGRREGVNFYAIALFLYCLGWIVFLAAWNLRWPGFALSIACFVLITWTRSRKLLESRPETVQARRSERGWKKIYRKIAAPPGLALAFAAILLGFALLQDDRGGIDVSGLFGPFPSLIDSSRDLLKSYQATHPQQLAGDVRDLSLRRTYGSYPFGWSSDGHKHFEPASLLNPMSPTEGQTFGIVFRTLFYPSAVPTEFRSWVFICVLLVGGLTAFVAGTADLLACDAYPFSGLVWKPPLRLAATLVVSCLLVLSLSEITAALVRGWRVDHGGIVEVPGDFNSLSTAADCTDALIPAIDRWASEHGYTIAALTSGGLADTHRLPEKTTKVTYQAMVLWKPGIFDRLGMDWGGIYQKAPELFVQGVSADQGSLISLSRTFYSASKLGNDAANALQKDLYLSLRHELAAGHR